MSLFFFSLASLAAGTIRALHDPGQVDGWLFIVLALVLAMTDHRIYELEKRVVHLESRR